MKNQKPQIILVLRIVIGCISALSLVVGTAIAQVEQQSMTLMDAVKATLSSSPDILLARETVSYYKAAVQEEKGAQDPVFSLDISQDRDDEPLTPYYQQIYEKEAEDTKTLTTTLTVTKELENGISLESYVEFERIDDNVTSFSPDNYGSFTFELTFPVLELYHRGFSKGEKASEMELKAGLRDLAYTVTESVETTAIAYWDAVAQKKILELYSILESESRQFLEEMTIMAEKHEYPFANLELLEADVDAKVVQRISQEQTVFAAQQTLLLAMGKFGDKLDSTYELVMDFPETVDETARIEDLIVLAKKKREDLAAEKHRVEYYEKLVAEAVEDTLPDLDLSLQAGYKGLDETADNEGYFKAIDENVEGPSYEVAVSYSVALGNNTNEGALAQAKSNLRKERITINRLESEITSDVLTTFQAYRNSIRVIKQQRDAVAKYKSALEKEILKFTYKIGDLSDRLSAAENYANSLVGLIEKQSAYAVALVQLRQACGALIVRADGKYSVNETDLLSPVEVSQMQ